jgi:hypothetical protein
MYSMLTAMVSLGSHADCRQEGLSAQVLRYKHRQLVRRLRLKTEVCPALLLHHREGKGKWDAVGGLAPVR